MEQLQNLLLDAEKLYEDAPCGYFSFLPSGEIIKINRTLLNWLGYRHDEVVGQMTVSDLLNQGGRLYYQLFYFPLLRISKGNVNEINFDLLTKSGSPLPSLLNATVVPDSNGGMLAINVAVTDITDRKKYEIELLRAKKLAEGQQLKIQLVSDFIPEMIWAADEKGRFNYFNKRFAELFGFNTLPDQYLSDSVHQQDRFSFLRQWVEGIRKGVDFQIRFRLLNNHGAQWHLLKAVPYVSDDGAPFSWLGSCININAHVMEMERKDEFVKVAGHELKTPVSILKLSLQLLQKEKPSGMPDRYYDLLTKCCTTVGKMGCLVDELLNTDIMNGGELQLKKTTFNLKNLLKVSSLHVQENRRPKVLIDCSDNLFIMADEQRIGQVVTNLVNNAIKYAPNSKFVNINAYIKNNLVVVAVEDEGPGIPAEKLPFIFERYYQIEKKGPRSGIGLGLYICSEIIRRHNGELSAKSELGKGSKFLFTLPM